MYQLLWFLWGYYQVELSGASPQWALNQLAQHRIPFRNPNQINEFTLTILVSQKHLKDVEVCAAHAMCRITACTEQGFPIILRKCRARPVLILLLAVTVFTACVLPQFVLFYQVTGNQKLSQTEILRALNEAGATFGIYGPNIDPQRIKNKMLNLLPELEWVTVNQNGCRAQVVVRERPEILPIYPRKGLANVVAVKGGLITKQFVYAGQPLVQIGDVVAEGDLLVSGIVDLERTCTVQWARAEIFARTWHENTTIIPEKFLKKIFGDDSSSTVWLCVGKKRIKIFGNSGISPWYCDKMTRRISFELPGNLEFPVSLMIQASCQYEPQSAKLDEGLARILLQEYSELFAMQNMVAGQILNRSYNIQRENGCYIQSSLLECHEMIAKSIDMQWYLGGE